MCPTQLTAADPATGKRAWLDMETQVQTMADCPVACRIYTRFLIEDWLR
jgi:hypothetical protein